MQEQRVVPELCYAEYHPQIFSCRIYAKGTVARGSKCLWYSTETVGSIQTGGKAPAIHGRWPKSARISARYPGKPCTTNCQPDPYPMFKQLNGRTYQLSPQSVGLFPLFIQVFHNNMTEGLREISFSYEKGIFYVLFLEGDTIHQIPVGFSTADRPGSRSMKSLT